MGGKVEMKDRELRTTYRIDDCTRCKNECASACPVFRHYGTYHPQQLAHLFLEGGAKAAHDHRLLWSCVTCAACTEACPFGVAFADFVRELRVGRDDYAPVFGGIIHEYQKRQARLGAASESTAERAGKGAAAAKAAQAESAAGRSAAEARLAWLDGSLDVNRGSDTILFVGCLSLFDSVLGEEGGGRFADMARAAVKILNRLGISPIVLADERCCGRDLFDIGDRDSFRALARHNLEAIRATGAKTVVTICPECAFTLKDTYAKETGDLPFEVPFAVRHITEIAAEDIGRLSFVRGEERLALHEPCYLCRYLGDASGAAKLLAALSTESPVELERRGALSPCCGAGSWVNHGPHTRTTVDERLAEAHRCGAGTLVTACPKCTLLHAEVMPEKAWRQSPVVVTDLITLAAARLR